VLTVIGGKNNQERERERERERQTDRERQIEKNKALSKDKKNTDLCCQAVVKPASMIDS